MAPRFALPAAALLSCLALAGCGVVPSTAPAAATASLSDDAQYPPTADATLAKCAAAGGVLKASGQVHNPTKAAYVYSVQVRFLDSSAATLDEVYADATAPITPG